MGISEPEFWKMTKRQLSALTKRFNQRHERAEILTGLLCAVTANFSMRGPGKDDEPYCPADFMPGHRRRGQALEPETDEDLAVQFAAALAPLVVAR